MNEPTIYPSTQAAKQALLSQLINPAIEHLGDYSSKFIGYIESDDYNRALRNLCIRKPTAGIHKMINIMMDFQVALCIDPDEQNSKNKSAKDYARERHPETLALLVKRQNETLTATATPGADTLWNEAINPLFGNSLGAMPSILRGEQPAASQTAQTEQLLKETYSQIGTLLAEQIPTVRANSEADLRRQIEAIASQAVSIAQSTREQLHGEATQTTSVGNIDEELQAISNQDAAIDSIIALYKNAEYHQALLTAAKTKGTQLLSKFFNALIENKTTLPFDINQMLDANGRTPMHYAAFEANWLAYYCLHALGANSSLADNYGISPQEIRRDKMLASTMAGQNPLETLFAAINPSK